MNRLIGDAIHVPMAATGVSVLPDRLAVCRLGADAAIPQWSCRGAFSSVTRTTDELSVVCPQDTVPPGVRCEPGWRAFKVSGPLDFGLTGVLVAIAAPLAEAGIAVFTVSTYDTDYVLVKDHCLARAIATIKQAGISVAGAGTR